MSGGSVEFGSLATETTFGSLLAEDGLSLEGIRMALAERDIIAIVRGGIGIGIDGEGVRIGGWGPGDDGPGWLECGSGWMAVGVRVSGGG